MADLSAQNVQLVNSEQEKIQQISNLVEIKLKLESDLSYMTSERDQLKQDKIESDGVLKRREAKINELEIQVYQLK